MKKLVSFFGDKSDVFVKLNEEAKEKLVGYAEDLMELGKYRKTE